MFYISIIYNNLFVEDEIVEVYKVIVFKVFVKKLDVILVNIYWKVIIINDEVVMVEIKEFFI